MDLTVLSIVVGVLMVVNGALGLLVTLCKVIKRNCEIVEGVDEE